MLKNKVVLTTLLALSPSLVFADQVTEADYQRAERTLNATTKTLITGTVDYPSWSDNGLMVYRTQQGENHQFIKVDPNTQKKSVAFDHQKLAKAIATLTEKEINAEKLPFYSVNFTADASIKLTAKGKPMTCDLSAYQCSEDTMVKKRYEMLSPDGKKAAFIKDHNLWVRDLATNEEKQLTKDGIEDFGYATNNAGWIKTKGPVMLWSPDSKKIATFKHDSRNVGEMYMVSTAVGHPELKQWKYPLPGDEHIFKITRVVIDVDKAKVTPLDMEVDDHRSTITDHVAGRGGVFLDVYWAQDGKSFAFVSSSRDHKHATVRIADANTGKVKTLFTETEETFFESGVDAISWRYLEKSNEILWFSQRDNWGHLYLYDAKTGKLKRQITEGDWTVREVLDVNQDTGRILFTGAGKEGGDPYFHYLYSVNKDGSGLTLLTPEKKHHRITLNDDASYFVDRIATPTEPEIVKIRSLKNGDSFIVDTMDISKLKAANWQAPIPFVVKDRDGKEDIYGLMYKPSNFDASKKYPVVNYLYPGPQVGSIRGRNFRASRGDNQAIAELGFIVIEIDALGTPGRSKSFHEFYYGNMGDSGIPDQVSAIQQLAKKHKWIDLDRVGIWGHSGGGFASTHAIFTFPDFYKVAVSQAGNHDNRNYADEWGEKWQGMFKENEDGTTNYDNQANQLFAKNLKGKLLLAHGTLDTNVPPYNTLVVVDALIKANKDFDLLMLPNRGHGFAREPYMMRKRWDYFVEHLMGATPPKEYTFGELNK